MPTKTLNIVFMGTPEFAVPSLEKIIASNHKVLAVVTAPDKPTGRGLQMSMSAVKKSALEHNIPVLQPTNLKSPEFNDELKSLNADLFIVVAFRMLPENIWSMPPLGTFNLHGSLLPNYRGAAPINWAIINGEKETGVTTFFLKHQIDTGNIILNEKIDIADEDNIGTIYEKLMHIGSDLVVKTCDMIASGNVHTKSQDELLNGKEPNHAPKIFKETCKLNFEQDVHQVHNLVRGLAPYPAAWFEINDTEKQNSFSFKVYKTNIENDLTAIPNTIKTDHKSYFTIGCKGGYISFLELQQEGKKRMQIKDFLNGFKFNEHYKIKA